MIYIVGELGKKHYYLLGSDGTLIVLAEVNI